MRISDDAWATATAVVLLAIGAGMAAMFFASAYQMFVFGCS